MYIGVDGCQDGWVAVVYDENEYSTTKLYETVNQLWEDYAGVAETILIDIPIGLREDTKEKRPCDAKARELLSPKRHSSVFPAPVRAAVHEDNYTDAKETQEHKTDGSLGVQSWGIADKIAELDTFLRETEPDATGRIREAHPEVCLWALNGKEATSFSKTGQPAAAFWERVEILEQVESHILANLRDASINLDSKVSNDDVVDAFALAVTASPKTGPLGTIPDTTPEGDDGDPTGLPMEMVYAFPQK